MTIVSSHYSQTTTPSVQDYAAPINIFPRNSFKAVRTINIRSTMQNTAHDINYYAKFTVIGSACLSPSVTILFQDTDFGGIQETKFLHVLLQNQFITACGSNANICGAYKCCLNNYPLFNESQSVLPGQQIIIHLTKGKDSDIPPGCRHSLWTNVTLNCKPPTQSPTIAPSMPTNNPTHAPFITDI